MAVQHCMRLRLNELNELTPESEVINTKREPDWWLFLLRKRRIKRTNPARMTSVISRPARREFSNDRATRDSAFGTIAVKKIVLALAIAFCFAVWRTLQERRKVKRFLLFKSPLLDLQRIQPAARSREFGIKSRSTPAR